MPKLFVTSYNPLSASAPVRRECILRELGRSHITCLQTTCVRQYGEQCVETLYPKHLWYDWGAAPGKHIVSIGVSIVLSKRNIQPKNVARVYVAPVEYQGRFGALRLRRADLDMCIICAYMYTEPQKQVQQLNNLRPWSYIGAFVEKLPHRCVPVVCLDANAHVGLVRTPGGEWQSEESESIGRYFAEPQNFSGGLFRTFLESQHMAAANLIRSGSYVLWPSPRKEKDPS